MAEGPATAGYFERLARVIEESVAIEQLLESLPEFELAAEESEMLFPPSPQPIQTRIAVAQDQSFHFYYEDGLDLLRAWGAELAPFSPLTDTQLPEGAGGIYIGGGFPELFGRALAANTAMHEALRAAAALGLPIYGECGGAMYLGNMLIDREGQCHRMVGLTPLVSRMMNTRLTLGYRTVTARRETFLLEVGEKLPVHEFHWSMGDGVAMEQAAYAIEGTDRVEGFADGNLLTSYMHVHFGSDGRLAQRFIAACR